MPFSITFSRVLRYGVLNLWRNRWLTITAISIMIITLLLLSSLLLIYQLAILSSQNLKDRVDVSIFFLPDVSEEKIVEVKTDFEEFEEVRSVEFVSAEQALEVFKEEHKDDPAIQQSLEEFKDNPLLPSLVITANELSLYPAIQQKISDSRFQPLISKVNFEDSRALIEKLDRVTKGILNTGIILTIVFGAIAVLVMFNTLRLTISSRREEIEIMRLVGASNYYIQGPFLIEGILYGLTATVFAALIFYPLLRMVSPWLVGFFGLDIISTSYFGENSWKIILIQLGSGIFLGVISSVIATKRYLKG